ncbi:MAG TPA: family 1 glycosylhydrolase [Acidimicrobiales bacterium]|nr:family 1 glycosylhydrolase [Acidimicrobiales bacterium]
MPTISFPDGFLWGTATAAHQVEGGNVNNDWWQFEHQAGTPCVESSGDACDSWHRWPEDLDLLASLGFGLYRFSLEWSRIEPAPGEWSQVALDHYRAMCEGCLARGLVPAVTFHHFTSPLWFAERGGWEADEAPERFAAFCAEAVARLGDVIGFACTLNEPNIVALMGYEYGIFPPGATDGGRRLAVNDAFCRAHRLAVEALRAGPGSFPVGLTLSMNDYQAVDGGEATRDALRRDMEDVYLQATGGDDFVGVQTYSRVRVAPSGMLGPEPGVPVTQMGYEFWPDALEATIRRATEVSGGVPVLVTENGIGTDDDTQRIAYVTEALKGVRRCMDDGIDVRGYVYWSLLDNFEWVLGYGPTFGLVAVDRATFERRPKPSAAWLGDVARSGALELGD